MATNFSPSNGEGDIALICRASKDADYRAENEVTNIEFPVTRSWTNEAGGFDDDHKQTTWIRAAAWKQAATRAAEIKKGDIIIVNFNLADMVAKPYTKNDGGLGASLEIARCRARVIHPKGESTYEGSVSQEPEPEAVAL